MNATTRTTLSLNRGEPTNKNTDLKERLHKVLANAGLGSRRMLEQRIEAGEVLHNGTPAKTGVSVCVGDRIELDQRQFIVASDNRSDAEVLIYNKPDGLLTTRDDPEGRATIFEQLPHIKAARWISVGRLDINTTGLLLLTTDGELANALMHPRSSIEREYLCRVHGEVPDTVIERLRAGVTLEDGPAHFEQIVVISRGASHSWFRVVLCEGRNREVRRMWDSQGCLVSRLKRIRYGSVELPRQLKRGQSETLDAVGVSALRQLAGLGDPSPTLTLKPVLHQRRASRNVTEVRASTKTPNAWTGAQHHNEARELTAYDRIRPESTGRRGKPGPRRDGKDVNGNVARPEGADKRKKRSGGRRVAPGQELPSVRTWFAGEQRPAGPGRGNNAGRNRNDASRGPGARNSSGKPGGAGAGRGNNRGPARGPGGPSRGPGGPSRGPGGSSSRGPGGPSRGPGGSSSRGPGGPRNKAR